MRAEITRELLAQCFVALGLTVSGWLLFVAPRANEATEVESEVARIRSEQPAVTGLSIEDLATPLERVRLRIEQIGRRNALSLDTSYWYERISDLAVEHGLAVDSIRPTIETAKAGAKEEFAMSLARIDVRVRGPYESVGAFVDALLADHGFLRPKSLSLVPAIIDGQRVVVARFSGEALAFALPEQLTGVMQEGRDDE